MVAFDILDPQGSGRPQAGGARQVCARARCGADCAWLRAAGETVRLLTPLTASDAILEEGLDHLETALSVIA
jgi:4-aminobutyrate aminotransferase/(S)-3-amino-2-methylpropionate transaminase